MIIQKATTNTNLIVQDLANLITLSSPTYLFILTSGVNVDYAVIPVNTTPTGASGAYSSFTITEGGNDPTLGNITLGTTGVYDLVIYEQASTTNLDPDNATKIEYGTVLARVISTASETSNYIEHVIDVTFIEHSVSL